jgi:multicomponent Na+:H+ antiporter subunit E
VAITESLDPGDVLTGLLVAVVIALLVRPSRTTLNLRRLPARTLALLLYILRLVIEIIQNGLFVASVVLRPKMNIRSAIIAVPSESHDDLGTAISAHGITVTPGELVVEVGLDRVMYVHCLDLRGDPAELHEAQKKRMALINRIIR